MTAEGIPAEPAKDMNATAAMGAEGPAMPTDEATLLHATVKGWERIKAGEFDGSGGSNAKVYEEDLRHAA